jgi:ribosomal-protein-alanine N-acetyltransferase
MGQVHIRWMIRRDMPRVMQIDDLCFEFPWTEDEYIRLLRQRNCIGMVAELDKEVVGYMIYELHKNRLHLIVFAVDPSYARRGIGTNMIGKLKSKLTPERRNRITCCVSDCNLKAHLFLRSMGFKATRVLRGAGADGTDEYEMVYRVKVNEVASDEIR